LNSPPPSRVVSTRQQQVALLALIGAVSAIAVVTLAPTAAADALPFWCIKCGDRPGVDVLLNIVLFVPFGAAIGLYRVRLARALVIAVVVPAAIEALQYYLIPGRHAMVRDLAANTLGALSGYPLGRYWRSLIFPRPVVARVIAVAMIAFWIGIQSFTAWAMRPALSGTQWWAQFAPRHDRFPSVFTGRLIDVSIGMMPIARSDRLPDTELALRSLEAGDALRVVVTGIDTTARMAPLTIIAAGAAYDVAGWFLDGRDAVFSAAVHGTLIGLRTPSVRLHGVVPDSRDDTLELRGTYSGGWYHLRGTSADRFGTRDVRASPSVGWAFLLPLPLYAFGAEAGIVTGAYLALVWMCIGYWIAVASTSRRAAHVAATAVGAALGLAAAPLAFGLPIAAWSEWLAVACGILIGVWYVGRRARRADVALNRS
jgi:hypothetical protein